MSNPFYNASGTPVTGSAGLSALMRSEFALVQTGFDKLPAALTPNKAVVINAGGTGMDVTAGGLALAGDFVTTGAFDTTLVQQASVALILPSASTILVGRDTTDTLLNKTLVNPVLTAPTMTAPVLGTPASGTLTNCTGLPNAGLLNSSVTIGSTAVALGATVATFAGVTLTSPILTAPVLGTPAAGVLTNCTGLPISTGISGLGTGIGTFLATPSSANLLAALTTKTGTGNAVFGTNPTFSGTITLGGTGTSTINTTGFTNTSFGQTASFGGPNIQFSGGDYAVFDVVTGIGVKLTAGATSWSAYSDESLKTDLIPITNASVRVNTLRAVTGRFKTDDEGVSRAFLIAQDVRAVLPEAVSVDKGGILALRYSEVIPLLVAALNEHSVRISELEGLAA